MSWYAVLLAAAAASVLLVLVVKLRGGGRGDLISPPRRKPRHLPGKELDRLTELVGRGEEEEVLRHLKSAGYDEARARRLLWFMIRIAGVDKTSGGGP